LELVTGPGFWSWIHIELCCGCVCVCECVCVCVCCVCFCSVCHFGNCTDCPTVTERAASVCFNFSYQQAAASDSLSRSLATSPAIPPSTTSSSASASASAFPQCHTILIAQWQFLLFYPSYNFKMNSWPVRRVPSFV